jgi:hypothetical protein
MGAWVENNVPCVLRQMLQWQKCTDKGSKELGRVKDRVEAWQ